MELDLRASEQAAHGSLAVSSAAMFARKGQGQCPALSSPLPLVLSSFSYSPTRLPVSRASPWDTFGPFLLVVRSLFVPQIMEGCWEALHRACWTASEYLSAIDKRFRGLQTYGPHQAVGLVRSFLAAFYSSCAMDCVVHEQIQASGKPFGCRSKGRDVEAIYLFAMKSWKLKSHLRRVISISSRVQVA